MIYSIVGVACFMLLIGVFTYRIDRLEQRVKKLEKDG